MTRLALSATLGPSGNALVILQVDRPNALVAAYEDPGNPHARR